MSIMSIALIPLAFFMTSTTDPSQAPTALSSDDGELHYNGGGPPEDAAQGDDPLAPPGHATETEDSTESAEGLPGQEDVVIFERLKVTGGPDRLRETPGSVHYITKDELDREMNEDVSRILRVVPGVSIQDEEGYGLRPNIGMRGTGSERSAKITLMEDGVLVAPAPYTAPAAYYFPTAGRMVSFEVMKGPAAIRQGPFTTGGVLNMISADYPIGLGGRVDLGLGTDATGKLRATVGETGERLSWLLETYQLQTDGFKDLDGGGDTGFELEDYLGKIRLTSRPEADTFQALELKLGRTTQLGNETYLGLADDDFSATPYRRYAASQEDRIDTDYSQYVIRYLVRPTASFDLTATVYRNDLFRNWHKLQSVSGESPTDILGDPETYADEIGVIRGDADSEAGDLRIRNNRRTYFGQGAQLFAGYRFGDGSIDHDLELSIRVHQDEEDRFQEEEGWTMTGGDMSLDYVLPPGSQSNRIGSANAVAVFLEDTIRKGRLTIRPGVRFESIDYTRLDYGKRDPDRTGSDLVVTKNSVEQWIPGLGVSYLFDDRWMVFGGIHRGFGPPGPGKSEETQAEVSVNYELGFRFGSSQANAEVVAFYNDYQNLLGIDSLSSGGEGEGDLFNGGAADVWGIEAGFDTDLSRWVGSRFSLPARATYTYTKGEFATSFESDYDAWGRVEAGDELPYQPEHQLFVSQGLIAERWGTFLSASYVDAMRTEAGRGPIPPGQGTDARLVFDLSGNVRLTGGLRLDLQIRNLTDEVYNVARRPAGSRPGLSRTAIVGITWEF